VRRSIARFLAIPVAAVGVMAGAAVAAPAAFAQTDTGGTVTVTVPLSYVLQLAEAGVVSFPVPLSELSVDFSTETATITFNVTGGDGDVNIFYGSVDLSGTLDIADANGNVVSVGGLDLNLENGDIEGTPAGSSTSVPLLDVNGNITYVTGTTSQSYDASELTVDPAGAAYLNSALHTSAFVAGQDVGSLAATWGFSE
jgi:hypothetical protein